MFVDKNLLVIVFFQSGLKHNVATLIFSAHTMISYMEFLKHFTKVHVK